MNSKPAVLIQMQPKDQTQLLAAILTYLAKWQSPPKELLRPIPPELLKILAEIMEQLKAEGLAGNRHRTSERMKRMLELLRAYLKREKAGPVDALDQIPPEAGRPMKAMESLQVHQSEAIGSLAMQKMRAGQVPAA